MNDYAGKICPYCKTEFKPGDDIIVCSQCDMPHHKDCWVENQGCTTFGCLGTIKAADNAASSVTATQMNYGDSTTVSTGGYVFCTQCGVRNADTSSFCTHCGSRLVSTSERAPLPPVYTQANPANRNPYSYMNQHSAPHQVQNNYQASGYNGYQSCETTDIDPDVQRLIGTKTHYYIPRFQVMKSQGKSASWNWPAFLVTPYWMIYRKMYGLGAAILAADIIISLIGSGFLSLLAFGGYIALGIFGNSVYMRHLERKADQAKAMSELYRATFIAGNSGVNVTATVLTIIGRALLMGILL